MVLTINCSVTINYTRKKDALLINGGQKTSSFILQNHLCSLTLARMFSFFSNRKPKHFNYKPRYQKDSEDKEKEKRISFKKKKYSNAMYDRYDRVPFTDLKKEGRKRIMIKVIVLVVLLSILILYLDKIEEMLKNFD